MAGGDFDLHGLILRIDFNLSVYTKSGQSQAEIAGDIEKTLPKHLLELKQINQVSRKITFWQTRLK
jgi:hypothetical protein